MIPECFKLLPVGLPPMLLELVGWSVESFSPCSTIRQGEARFLAFYYAGSKATVTDGRGLKTFSFYGVWKPWTDHVLMALPLVGCDLGTDDSEAKHCLIADTLENRVYVAPWSEGVRFCQDQHPPVEPLREDQRAAIEAAVKKQIAAMQNMGVEDLQRLGMFELFLPASKEQMEGYNRLWNWLDCQITEDSLKPYEEMLKTADEGIKAQMLFILELAARA